MKASQDYGKTEFLQNNRKSVVYMIFLSDRFETNFHFQNINTSHVKPMTLKLVLAASVLGVRPKSGQSRVKITCLVKVAYLPVNCFQD